MSILETRKTSLASDISPAFLLSGFLAQAPAHGYELHQKITLHLGRLWRMSLSQTYSTLKRLEAKGWIRGEVQEQVSLPARYTYSLTAKGREIFEVWLSTPTPASARAIRVEFITRLFFSSDSFLPPAHFFPLLLLVFSLSSCQPANPTQEYPPLSQPALIVAAASDLQFAFTEIAAQFEAETGSAVTLVFGSTGQLTQQIENGAPYDVFAAAQIDYLDRLAAKGHIDSGKIELYGRGRLVLAANQGYSNPIENLADLLAPEIRHIAIANPSHAPYGLAAYQALQSAGLWEALQPKIVIGETVRQALQYVQTGDAEAGLVALSTADVPEIRWILLDEQLHVPLEQAIAVVSASSQPELAARFISFVSGEEGRLIMRKYGFLLPGEDFYPNNPETLQ